MAERKMPQNLEAEMMALGCAFLTRYACDKVCEDLDSDMFVSDANKRIFEAIYTLHQNKIYKNFFYHFLMLLHIPFHLIRLDLAHQY